MCLLSGADAADEGCGGCEEWNEQDDTKGKVDPYPQLYASIPPCDPNLGSRLSKNVCIVGSDSYVMNGMKRWRPPATQASS